MIDYQRIIEELSIDKVKELLYRLGAVDVIEKPGLLITNTICHNENAEEASMKLYYYNNSHMFVCYTDEGPQSIFQFLKNYYKTRNIEYDWYNDIYLVVVNCSNFNPANGFTNPKYKSILDKYTKNEMVELPTYPNGIIDCFINYYPIEWLNEGITKETMDKFNIRYSPSRNKIIIPHYNINNELVGIRGRALDEWEIENVGKYMPIKIENQWYNHPLSLNLYGLNVTKENIKKEGYCFLFEGEKSVLQMESFKRPNCAVAVCGSQFNKHSLKILIKECKPKEIVICFDKEELPHEEQYFNKLYKIGEKYKNYCNFSFIYDRENLINLKDSPVDKGEKVFESLLRKKVTIK